MSSYTLTKSIFLLAFFSILFLFACSGKKEMEEDLAEHIQSFYQNKDIFNSLVTELKKEGFLESSSDISTRMDENRFPEEIKEWLESTIRNPYASSLFN